MIKESLIGIGVLGIITLAQNAINVPKQAVVEAVQAPEKKKVVVDTPIKEKPREASATCASEINKYDWNKKSAYNIMMYESSGGNHLTVNDNPSTGDYSIGCFQINIIGGMKYTRPSETELKDPKVNVKFAYQLYKRVGFCSTEGWYNTCRKLGMIQ